MNMFMILSIAISEYNVCLQLFKSLKMLYCFPVMGSHIFLRLVLKCFIFNVFTVKISFRIFFNLILMVYINQYYVADTIIRELFSDFCIFSI